MNNKASLICMNNSGVTIWLTGLSGSGKTTICEALQKELQRRNCKLEVLDGDIVRENLSKGLTFSKEDRDINVRRIGFVAHLLTRNGVIVLVSAISPYRAVRDEIRQQIGAFVEVHVSAPLEVCEQRDVKGLYERARAGLIKGFTGIDDPYEAPVNPEINCATHDENVNESVEKIIKHLEESGCLEREVAASQIA